MINIVLGTKAQLIKMAPVMKALQEQNINYHFIHTGQHKETMDKMYQDFGIKQPDLLLYDGPDISSVRQILPWFLKLLWRTAFRQKEIFKEKKNSVVLVHGDTFSTLLGAFMGRIARVKVAHVESGLRSFNIFHPFPEELTRLAVFRLSHILFCPGQWAIDNVKQYSKVKINTQANTLHDTVALSRDKLATLHFDFVTPFGLVSLHRYENIFKPRRLIRIVEQLEVIALKYRLVFILHPPTKKQLLKYDLLGRLLSNPHIECKNRYSHSLFLQILHNSDFVVTDGGSLQEETSYLGKPCLIMRKTTERTEGIGENAILSMFNLSTVLEFIDNYKDFQREQSRFKVGPSEIIVQNLKSFY